MANSFEWRVAQLEGIAAEECQCSEDVEEVCRACVAARTLNRMNADAYDTLEELTE